MKLGLKGWLLLLGSCLFLFAGQTFQAAEQSELKSDVSIYFEKGPDNSDEVITEPKPEPTDKPRKPLPKTGEMLASLLVLLSGVSLVIFTIGLYAVKQVYQLEYKEG